MISKIVAFFESRPWVCLALASAVVLALDWLALESVNPQHFQRLGSVIVLVGILFTARIVYKSQALAADLLAKELRNNQLQDRIDNKETKLRLRGISGTLKTNRLRNFREEKEVDFDPTKLDEEIEQIEAEIQQNNADIEGRSSRNSRWQNTLRVADAAIFGLGTMQWGYGDLFHCWINGNGWKVC